MQIRNLRANSGRDIFKRDGLGPKSPTLREPGLKSRIFRHQSQYIEYKTLVCRTWSPLCPRYGLLSAAWAQFGNSPTQHLQDRSKIFKIHLSGSEIYPELYCLNIVSQFKKCIKLRTRYPRCQLAQLRSTWKSVVHINILKNHGLGPKSRVSASIN